MALQKLDGVATVEVSFQDKTAIITMKDGRTIGSEAVDAALKEAGHYAVSSFKEKTDNQ